MHEQARCSAVQQCGGLETAAQHETSDAPTRYMLLQLSILDSCKRHRCYGLEARLDAALRSSRTDGAQHTAQCGSWLVRTLRVVLLHAPRAHARLNCG